MWRPTWFVDFNLCRTFVVHIGTGPRSVSSKPLRICIESRFAGEVRVTVCVWSGYTSCLVPQKETNWTFWLYVFVLPLLLFWQWPHPDVGPDGWWMVQGGWLTDWLLVATMFCSRKDFFYLEILNGATHTYTHTCTLFIVRVVFRPKVLW